MADSRFPRRSAIVMVLSIGMICVALSSMAHVARAALDDDRPQTIGDWSGESMCQVKNSPCHDEKVVYHITTSKDPGKVSITADKIVDGRPVTMGSGDYDYDEEKETLINESSRGVWRFIIRGRTMDGTLTLPDKTLYRRISLWKEDK